jgi:hypothetical protein
MPLSPTLSPRGEGGFSALKEAGRPVSLLGGEQRLELRDRLLSFRFT